MAGLGVNRGRIVRQEGWRIEGSAGKLGPIVDEENLARTFPTLPMPADERRNRGDGGIRNMNGDVIATASSSSSLARIREIAK
jgi:hypothetical protein